MFTWVREPARSGRFSTVRARVHCRQTYGIAGSIDKAAHFTNGVVS